MGSVEGYGCAHKLIGLLRTRDWSVAETSDCKNVTFIRDIHVPVGLEYSAAADPSLDRQLPGSA